MSTEMIACALCGNQMPANARFCPECGSTNARVASSDRSSLVMPPPPSDAGDNAPSEGGARVYDTPPASMPTVNMSAAGGTPQYTPPMTTSQAGSNPSQASYGEQSGGVGNQPPQSAYAYTPPPQHGQTQGINQPPAPSYTNYSSAPLGGQYPSQAGTFPRDGTIALLLELLGYIWFLGIGHMYGGRIGRGIALLIGWWAYWGIVLVLLITVVLSPLACLMAILWPVVPIISGFWIKNDLDKQRTY